MSTHLDSSMSALLKQTWTIEYSDGNMMWIIHGESKVTYAALVNGR